MIIKNKSLTISLLALSCLLCRSSSAQNNDSLQYKFSSEIISYIRQDSAYWLGGITASDLSFIGLYKEALIQYDKPRQYRTTIPAADSIDFLKKYHAVEARQYLLEKAKKERIIIFNEAHYNPRHRVFVTSLLKDLSAMGYRYFAAETFINDSSFFTAKHPGFETGFYCLEPQFGNLVREAAALGFHLYPYEDTTGADGKEREIGQARNLAALFKMDANAKMIVCCGFDHVIESPIPRWEKAMAGRLKEFTGIDPFTIDQVTLAERSSEDLASPYFRLTHANQYSVLVDKENRPFTTGKVDALLYSPQTEYVYNRPKWIFENDKVPYFLNKLKVNMAFPLLVKVYLATDDLKRAIPTDLIEIKTKEEWQNTAIAVSKKKDFIVKLSGQNGAFRTIPVKGIR